MLAQRPPMGWNSWNTFGGAINEQVVRETADAIIEKGLKDVGYEYVVIDDCWSLRKRNAEGKMVADPEKFPSGMKALAEYVHSKGLKFGMYSCAGTRTCAGYPGSFDYEFVDAKTFAEWDVDFLKYDFCYKPRLAHGPILYNRMGMALKASGREILFSACNWGSNEVEKWIRSTGAHMYRSTGDINDSFQSFKDIAMSQVDKLAYSGPGCYNDIDMLICGMHGKGNVANGGCSDIEYRTHFALWCLFQSPLMIGGDLNKLDDFNLELLKNKELIDINQDIEARPPMMIGGGDRPVFFKHMANGEYVLAFFNFSDRDGHCGVEFYDLGLTVASGYGFKFRDIFTGEETGLITENMDVHVASHDCKIYRGTLEQK
ncbi:MAG: glycoside hydrolase family 27 protein [Clostridia bacterium]|nr:glycoside hydrolase family 27 protein [Clostridia bacterium]